LTTALSGNHSSITTVQSAPEAPVEPVAAPSHTRRWTPELVVAALVVLTGVVLRFLTTSALWLDEAQTVAIARLPLADIPSGLRRDGAPPLYYVLLHGWMRLFGDGDVALRALAGVFSVATIAVAALVVARVAGRRAALIAAVLLATNPFAIRYATENRMYSLVALETALGLLAAVAIVRHGRRRRYVVALALVVAALLYTQYWGLYFVAASFVALAVWYFRAPHPRPRAPVRIAVALAAGLVLWLPWVPTFVYQSRHTGTPWASPAPPATVLTALFDLNGGFAGASIALTILVLIGAGMALVARRTASGRVILEPPKPGVPLALAGVVVATLVIAIGLGLAGGVAYATRYLSVALVPFLIVAALGFARLGRPAQRVLVGAAVVFGLIAAFSTMTAQRTQAPRFAAVLARAHPGDVIVYCPDQLGPATNRLIGDRVTQFGYPRRDAPAMVNWVDYAQAWDDVNPVVFAGDINALAGTHDVWLVVSTLYHGTENGCQALETALRAERPNGYSEVAANGHYFENAWLLKLPPG
jgi:4-amino-4-deoxy-L-arabinose transferase-like glycosyltransferase